MKNKMDNANTNIKKIKIPELLAPAGGIESAIAAINAGADALYLGGKNFSARNLAQNFTQEELVSLIEYAALRRVKIYIAVNTLYKNDEIPQVLEFAKTMYQEGAAAFILQDPGLAYMIKQKCPAMEIHASTQMTVHSTSGVHFMESMGFSRVVLSRELSLNEVREINKAANIECEAFVHGALCISYSGQCLMSSLIGGRSGNRGRCAQICRTKYDLIKNGNDICVKNNTHTEAGTCIKSGYLLSPKDMMTIEMLGDIVATGVSSLKIEGRMKSPEYVYLVTKAYRWQLDNIKAGKPADISKDQLQDLLQIFNRGGSSSTGYYNTYAGLSMMSTVTPKSTGVLVGMVVSYKNGRCKIKFNKNMVPGDGIEIWTSRGKHVGKGVERVISTGETFEFSLEGGIEKGNEVYKSYDKKLISDVKKEMAAVEKKVYVCGEIEAVIGAELKLSLSRDGHNVRVTATGDIVEAAQRAPMSKDEIIRQISKTGNTPYILKFEKANIDENIFVSKSALNQLRRAALEMFEAEVIRNSKKELPETMATERTIANNREFSSEFSDRFSAIDCAIDDMCKQKLSIQLRNISHLDVLIKEGISKLGISRLYIDYTPENIAILPQILDKIHLDKACIEKGNTEIFIALPYISRNSVETDIKKTLIQLESTAVDGYLVSTYGQLHILKTMGSQKQIMLNYTFNIFNDWAVEAFESMGIRGITLSQELNIGDINGMKFFKPESYQQTSYQQESYQMQLGKLQSPQLELIVYGRQILMSTHNCPVGIYGTNNKKGQYCSQCNDKGSYGLRDKMGMVFPLLRDCHNCIAYVLNSKTLDMSPKFQGLKATGAGFFRLIFTKEDEKTIYEVVKRYKDALAGVSATDVSATDTYQSQDATYGHFFRGVE